MSYAFLTNVSVKLLEERKKLDLIASQPRRYVNIHLVLLKTGAASSQKRKCVIDVKRKRKTMEKNL